MNKKTFTFTTVIASGLLTISAASFAGENPFRLTTINSNQQIAADDTQENSGTAGEAMPSSKSTEAKCGANKMPEGKTKEASCGGNKKMSTDKNKEASCGANKKAAEATDKMQEGKCGTGKK